MKSFCYAHNRDLLGYAKEYILLELYRAVNPDVAMPDVELAKLALERARRKDGVVEDFCDMPVHVNFYQNPLDFSGFVQYHGSELLENAILACQIDAIGNNPYLCDLEEKVSRFGMIGKFINYYHCPDPLYCGIYFVCGYDRNRVLGSGLNVMQIVKDMRTAGVMPLDIIAVRVTGGGAYAAHQFIVHHCLNASTMRALGVMYGLPKRLDKISTNFMKNTTMLCRNILDKKLGMTGQMENKIARDNFFPVWARVELDRGGLDADDYTLHTAPEKKSLFEKHMVSLDELAAETFNNEKCKFIVPPSKYTGTNFVRVEQLIYLVGLASNICAVTVDRQDAQRLFDNLLGCGVLFSRADSKMKSTFIYDGKQLDIIQPIFCRTMKEALFICAKPFSYMVKTYGGAAIRGIHMDDLDRVADLCEKAGIDICLDMPEQHFLHAASAEDFNRGHFICTVGISPECGREFNRLTAGMDVLHNFCVDEEPAHGWRVVYGTLDSIKEIRAWLKAHDIRYFLAKPSVVALTGIAAKTGFGPGKNVQSSIMIVLDSICSNALEYALLKAKFPEYFHYSLEDVQANGKVRALACVSSDLDRVFTTCKHYDIPICFDESHVIDKHYDVKIGFDARAYRLLYSSAHELQIISMIEQIMNMDAADRMLTPDDLHKYNHNHGPVLPPSAEQIRELEAYARTLLNDMK